MLVNLDCSCRQLQGKDNYMVSWIHLLFVKQCEFTLCLILPFHHPKINSIWYRFLMVIALEVDQIQILYTFWRLFSEKWLSRTDSQRQMLTFQLQINFNKLCSPVLGQCVLYQHWSYICYSADCSEINRWVQTCSVIKTQVTTVTYVRMQLPFYKSTIIL